MIAICSSNIIGIILHDSMQEVIHKDGTKSFCWTGRALLTDEFWHARSPRVIGHIKDLIASEMKPEDWVREMLLKKEEVF
jgi:hypothetical protein